MKPDVAFIGHGTERIEPFAEQISEIDFPKAEIQLVVLELAEIENFINKPLEYLNVFIGKTHENFLILSKVSAFQQLVDGLGNKCERRAKVVGHIGEEHKF